MISINNFEESFSIPGPACVEKKPPSYSSNKKCWRFWTTNSGTVTHQYFACGETAYYQADPGLPHNGAWLVVDGQIQIGTWYYYWSEGPYARHLREATIEDINNNPAQSQNCSACLPSNQWTLIIKDASGRQYYEKKFTEEPIVRVDCNGCPPGHIRCKCASYPGYCCIPCKEIQNEISAMIGILRRMR